MILKLLINFYRWLWGMPPLAIHTINEQTLHILVFGAMIDVIVIIGIVACAIRAYRKKAR
jgi:hypothetical protein